MKLLLSLVYLFISKCFCVKLNTKNIDLRLNKKFFIETHGCQMNLADSDIVRSVLLDSGYEMCDVLEEADLILTNTCAIRENAESKIWQRLKYFASLRKKAKKQGQKPLGYPLVGVLGCMAERLKTQLLEEEGVDFVAGPDAYRDLPRLLNMATTDQKAANTQLSIEETYSDINPVRLAEGNTHAFITITRGCDNHCAFCIVPYTRGRERSRSMEGILFEVEMLKEQGYKEVVLLGQNVNSYNYIKPSELGVDSLGTDTVGKPNSLTGRLEDKDLTPGFTQPGRRKSNVVQVMDTDNDIPNSDGGVRFGELLERVSRIDPEMRIRFQSPHPKDFPTDLLHLIANTPNICNSLHLPAQHGSNTVLGRMNRGYTRESYLDLINRARDIIGKGSASGLGISSDFISGFCGENEEEHRENLSLLTQVGFDQTFTYSYSKREQTYAGLFYQDDVPELTKGRRLQEMIDTFQSHVFHRNLEIEIGQLHIVLVEGMGKPNKDGSNNWTGRTDTNKRVLFSSAAPVLNQLNLIDYQAFKSLPVPYSFQDFSSIKDPQVIKEKARLATSETEIAVSKLMKISQMKEENSKLKSYYGMVEKGSYVIVKIAACRGHTLRAVPIALTSIKHAYSILNML